MITQPFHVRTKTLIAKIQLYNNSYYCFKNDAQYILPKGWSGEEKGGKKLPKTQEQDKVQVYSRNLWEAQMPKTFFIHY